MECEARRGHLDLLEQFGIRAPETFGKLGGERKGAAVRKVDHDPPGLALKTSGRRPDVVLPCAPRALLGLGHLGLEFCGG
jgi:hypothetical protein